MSSQPVVYLLYGDDEFAINEVVTSLQAKLGNPTTAGMNTTRLDGLVASLDDLAMTARAMPLLAKRRLVIMVNPLARFNTPTSQNKFKALLDSIPDSTALVLVEYHPLTTEKERKAGKTNWLEAWADAAGERAYKREYTRQRGEAMTSWIMERAKRDGGEFTLSAAERLYELTGDEPRLTDQEIIKLLTYVNYARPVAREDVEHLTPEARQGNIFNMVDSLGNKDGKKAQEMLHHLLQDQEPRVIFAMVVRQFRLLIQAREVLDNGGRENDVTRELKIPPFISRKLVSQAHHFSLSILEIIYHRLLDLDESIKTGQIEELLALDTFIAGFTV